MTQTNLCHKKLPLRIIFHNFRLNKKDSKYKIQNYNLTLMKN